MRTDLCTDRRRQQLLVGLAEPIASAGQALAGSADMAVLTAAAAAIYAALHAWEGERTWRVRIANAACIGLAGVAFAAMLAAVQWVPALYLLRGASRAAQDPTVRTAWSVHPASLADLFFPRLVAEMLASGPKRRVVVSSFNPLALAVV